MIIDRYVQRNICLGALLALLVLVSLSLFFSFVRELDDLGEDGYGVLQMVEYLALIVPGKIVEFMPLAVLLGCMLSLGAMASNSEIIAMQASGSSLRRLIGAVLQAGLVMALLNFAIADWVVPLSETSARGVKNQSQQETSALRAREGLWIKDGNRVLYLHTLLPNGYARDVEIYELGGAGEVKTVTRAKRAVPEGGGWHLQQVEQSVIGQDQSTSRRFEYLLYPGNLSHDLLQVLLIEPRQMSSRDLHAYVDFLDENRLDAEVERLIFWQKIFAPVTVLVMCLLAIPFVLGPQRQSNTGYRLMIGILLGLAFVVTDRLMIQLGSQWQITAFVTAVLPNLIFLALALYFLARTQSHGLLSAIRPGFR